jgi:hypothetical protein
MLAAAVIALCLALPSLAVPVASPEFASGASLPPLVRRWSKPNVIQQCATGVDGKLPTWGIPPGFAWSGMSRQYYLSVDEIEWDYADSGWDNTHGVPMSESIVGKVVVELDFQVCGFI